jgi:prepilin-type N-terminal cleavage/methylation domain-containing protein
MKQNLGFSLIEMIVVVGLVGILMVSGVAIFLNMAQISVKNKALLTVKQSGNFALDFIDKKIRNAKSVVVNGNSLLVTEQDGSVKTLACSVGFNHLTYDTVRIINDSNLIMSECLVSLIGTKRANVTFKLEWIGLVEPETFSQEMTLRNYQTP